MTYDGGLIQRSLASLARHLATVSTAEASRLVLCVPASKDRPPPIIRQGPSNQTQAVGGVAVLRCLASGDPEPTITWLKDRASLLGKDPRMALLDHGSLQIQDTQVPTTRAGGRAGACWAGTSTALGQYQYRTETVPELYRGPVETLGQYQ